MRRAAFSEHCGSCTGMVARGSTAFGRRGRALALPVFQSFIDPPDLGLQRGKVFGAFETSKRDDPLDEGRFDLLHADKFKFRIRRGARRLKRRHVLGVAGDLARQDFNLSFEFRANGKGQPVAECVLTSALLSLNGTRPGAFFRIAPVCRNLPFAKPACR